MIDRPVLGDFATTLDLFDAVVERHGDAEAVVHEGARLSFREWATRADALAGWLIGERGIRKGDVVIAISFEPYGRETQYCLRVAHHHQAQTLIITDSRLSPLARYASAQLFVKEGSAFAFRALTSTICLCQALFVALAYRLELNVEESKDNGGYDD